MIDVPVVHVRIVEVLVAVLTGSPYNLGTFELRSPPWLFCKAKKY
jgi:hypothetical protein